MCYPNINNYVEEDNIYLETHYSYKESNDIYKYFGNHLTLHTINDYGKVYKHGYIFHKDQYIPFIHYWLEKWFPSFIRFINIQQKHIVCSCKGDREVIILNDNCSKKVAQDYDNLHDIISPHPVYIKDVDKVLLSDITKYEFTLNENECLFFNPYIQFHKFKGSEDNISQVHFFMMGIFSPIGNLYIPFEPKIKLLKQIYNRNIYQMKHVSSEKI